MVTGWPLWESRTTGTQPPDISSVLTGAIRDKGIHMGIPPLSPDPLGAHRFNRARDHAHNHRGKP
jgi:hypothetical protein